MKFYLNNIERKVEILPSLNEVLDETLDSFSLKLLSNEDEFPYAPSQAVRIELEDEQDTILYFLVATDSVDIFSLNPVRYKHTITLVQNIKDLTKYTVRNSVFTQPAKTKEAYFAICEGLGEAQSWQDTVLSELGHLPAGNPYTGKAESAIPLLLDSNEKIRKTYVRIDVQCAIAEQNHEHNATWLSNIHTIDDINNAITGKNTNNPVHFISVSSNQRRLVLSYIDANGVNQSENFNANRIGGEWRFNELLECPRIVELSKEGATNFTLTTAWTDYGNFERYAIPFVGSVLLPERGTTPAFISCQIKIIAETYYHNCYELLDLLLKRQAQKHSAHYLPAPFKLPTRAENAELYDLLNNTIPPNFFFTNITLFECVAEIFRLFDAIFTLDGEKTLNIEYFNDKSNKITDLKKTGQNTAISDEKYINGLVCYYQDARPVVKFPSRNAYAPFRSAELGVPDNTQHDFLVDKPIQQVNKLNALVKIKVSNGYPNGGVTNQVTVSGNLELDISYFAVTDDIATILPTTVSGILPSDYNTLYQQNVVTYAKGDNKIKMGFVWKSWFGIQRITFWSVLSSALWRQTGIITTDLNDIPTINIEEGDWSAIYLKCEYIASTDGRLKIETLTNKHRGDMFIEQVNGGVDLGKVGQNLLGIAVKMGETTLGVTHTFSDWKDRIKKGDYVIYKGELWVANTTNFTFFSETKIQERINFVKNFNEFSLYTKIDRAKRMSNIDTELVTKSEDNLLEYVYYSSKQESGSFSGITIPSNTLYESIKKSFYYDGDDSLRITNALIWKSENFVNQSETLDFSQGQIIGNQSTLQITINNVSNIIIDIIKVNDPLARTTVTYEINNGVITFTATQNVPNPNFTLVSADVVIKGGTLINFPLIKYGSGNAVCFEMSFNEPMSAGNQTTVAPQWYGANKYFTGAVIYPNKSGFLDKNDLIFYCLDTDLFDHNYPEIILKESDQLIAKISDYEFYKQPNEILALNYEIIFLPINVNRDYISPLFIENNYFTKDEPVKEKIYLFYTTANNDFQYSLLDTEGEGESIEVTSVTRENNAIVFTFSAVSNIKTWAICDARNKILFASNDNSDIESENITQKRIYIYPTRDRI